MKEKVKRIKKVFEECFGSKFDVGIITKEGSESAAVKIVDKSDEIMVVLGVYKDCIRVRYLNTSNWLRLTYKELEELEKILNPTPKYFGWANQATNLVNRLFGDKLREEFKSKLCIDTATASSYAEEMDTIVRDMLDERIKGKMMSSVIEDEDLCQLLYFERYGDAETKPNYLELVGEFTAGLEDLTLPQIVAQITGTKASVKESTDQQVDCSFWNHGESEILIEGVFVKNEEKIIFTYPDKDFFESCEDPHIQIYNDGEKVFVGLKDYYRRQVALKIFSFIYAFDPYNGMDENEKELYYTNFMTSDEAFDLAIKDTCETYSQGIIEDNGVDQFREEYLEFEESLRTYRKKKEKGLL